MNVEIKNFPSGTKPYDTSYAVNWHYPYEDWTALGAGATFDSPSYEIYGGSGYVTSGHPANVNLNIPTSTVTDSAGIIVSGTLGVTGSAIGTTGGAELIGLSSPESAVAATLLIAASYLVSATAGSAPGTVPFPTGEDNFQDSLLIRQTLTATPGAQYYTNHDGNTRILFDSNAQRFGSGASQIKLTSADPSDLWYYPNVWGGSQGPVSVQVVPGRIRWVRPYSGHHYGQNGYIGPVTTNLRFPGGYEYK